jgi:very-short-patch-repair endonuclease
MASSGSSEQQRQEVARVATLLFGAPVAPEDVTGETLERATPEPALNNADFRSALSKRISEGLNVDASLPSYESFVRDPLSRWIESTFGVTTETGTGALIRATPRPVGGSRGAASELGRVTGVNAVVCAERIKEQLLVGSQIRHPETGFPVFAFRLHQFISRGETVYASIESEADRYLTLHPQKFVPGDRSKLLVPLVFCRECGQEYYTVHRLENGPDMHLEPRTLHDRKENGEGDVGYLYINTARPWVFRPEDLPDDWLEPGEPPRVKYHLRPAIPREMRVTPDGRSSDAGVVAHFIPAPFRFCLRCGVAYGGRARTDFAKLATLGSEGRSTATTLLSLSAVRHLRHEETIPAESRKLLSFTDNRQDASLQAGHFNDFVEVGLLRSALYKAAQKAGNVGLSHDILTQSVFETIALPMDLYALDPTVKYAALSATQKALRDVLGYRLYLDLRRGWRIMSPNLEQTGLLHIEYESLRELVADDLEWTQRHPVLCGASPEIRANVSTVLLDHLRRELCVKVDYLDQGFQERLTQASSQHLRSPWAIDENEKLEHASIALPRSERTSDYGGWTHLSARSGFGQYLRRRGTFPTNAQALTLNETSEIIRDLLEALRVAGLVVRVREPEDQDDVPGYQVSASALRWTAGDGNRALHDPIRVPKAPEAGKKPNRFFLEFYRTAAADGQGLEAREHTAQVPYDARIDREKRFRTASLPVLFCSPTMELGVDIASLNVVNMRNVPPTPANYAQRSGRAGRSGQPSLVITYCSTGSPHDQYFYRRPHLMVSGQVAPPRLDLANEDLIRAHVHAIWLAETGMNLGRSLKDMLDVSGEPPSLKLLDSKKADIENQHARSRAIDRARRVLSSVDGDLQKASWWSATWLDEVFRTVGLNLDAACERWRSLYRSALAQYLLQSRIVADASRSAQDKNEAKKLRREAESQLELLTAASGASSQSDFYAYRYFASEGFLPGYSFPRLPISAFIPGRRLVTGTDEFLSRPRFLAVSEFGPGNFVYHEGSRYVINRVILPVSEVTDPANGKTLNTTVAKICAKCAYIHPVTQGDGLDLCQRCGAALPAVMRQLFRMQNVTTRRRDRINSDEEERQRKGYELQTAIRFADVHGHTAVQTATVGGSGGTLAKLAYGHASTIWRINRGWKRRRRDSEIGFVLDVERGYWARDKQADPEDGNDDPVGPLTRRVVPFVEDHKNALLIEPVTELGPIMIASLQAALKHAIQVTYQLEDGELAAEPLPNINNRHAILLYEAAEGGAGVLRRLVDDPGMLNEVTRSALELCHFDPDTGADRGSAPGAKEKCEAACYDCIMSYGNQPDHDLLDRSAIRDVLLALSSARVETSPAATSRDEHLEGLMRQAGSDLERRWLRFLSVRGYRLPTHAGKLFEAAGTRPDFYYEDDMLAVYIDGPPHRFPDRVTRDQAQQRKLEQLGFLVVRFQDDSEVAWEPIILKYPSVFGVAK